MSQKKEELFGKILQGLQEGQSQQNEQHYRGLLERYREETAGIKQERELQKGVARWVKWVVSLWLLFIALVVVSVGKSWLNYSDGVLMTLLATTTVNIIGLAYFMAKGLFPGK